MKRTGFAGAYWPTTREELMLKAALLEGQAAVEAWRRLAPVFEFDRIGGDALNLAPLLGRNLIAQGEDDPTVARMRGLYKRTWYRNQLQFRDAAVTLSALGDAGIPTMVLKGAALVALGIRDAGLRPMADVDILVPREDAARSIGVLDALGGRRPKRTTNDLVRLKYGVLFRAPSSTACDLHWRVMKRFESLVGGPAEPDFWPNAQRVTLGGADTLAPDPTDHLFLVCTHAAWWTPPSRVRWVADAHAILSGGEKLDWDRMIELARVTSSVLPIRETLTYLHRLLDLPIPSETLSILDQIPITPRDKAAYRLAGRRPSRWLGGRPVAAYVRLSNVQPLDAAIVGFPQFVRDYYRVKSLWDVPARIGR